MSKGKNIEKPMHDIGIREDCENMVACLRNSLNPNAGNMMNILVKEFFPKTDGIDKALPVPEGCVAKRILSEKYKFDAWFPNAATELENWIMRNSEMMEKEYFRCDGEPLVPLRLYHESHFGISNMMMELIVAVQGKDKKE